MAREASLRESLRHGLGEEGGGAQAVRSRAQDRGIPCLEAQRTRIGRHVRPAFEDHPDDAERGRHALDDEAVGSPERRQHPPHRIRQIGDAVHARRDGLQAGPIEGQAVDERGGEAPSSSLADIVSIGCENRVRPGPYLPRRGAEGGVLHGLWGVRKLPGGRPGVATKAQHHGRDAAMRRCGRAVSLVGEGLRGVAGEVVHGEPFVHPELQEPRPDRITRLQPQSGRMIPKACDPL
jgi:hypothetical protein